MMDIPTLSSAQFRRMAEVAAQVAPWSLPVVEAMQNGLIAGYWLGRKATPPLEAMHRSDRPLMLWLGDDDDMPTGPNGWRCAADVTRWARAGMVHAAAGHASHYAAAVAGTLQERRFALIETSSRHALAWAALLDGKPLMGILPRGGQHPVEPVRVRH